MQSTSLVARLSLLLWFNVMWIAAQRHRQDERRAIELNSIGNSFLKKGQLEKALQNYDQASTYFEKSHAIHSNILSTLVRLGRPLDAVQHAIHVGLIDNQTGVINSKNPLSGHDFKRRKDTSIYGILGVAFHNLDELDLAVDAFRYALLENEKDGNTWMNLGDCLLHMRKANYSIWAYENALLVHNVSSDFSPLLRSRSWLCDWRDRENLELLVLDSFKRLNARGSATNASQRIRATGDFLNVDAKYMLKKNKILWSPHHEIPRLIPENKRSVLNFSSGGDSPPLNVGFLSSDFGVHPVSSLIRGTLGFLNETRIQAYVFISTKQTSWWRENITSVLPSEQVIDIFGLDKLQAAKKILSKRIDILIDLNGLTLHSALQVCGLRPAPVQISFLGFPMSTGSKFIDYFISDKVATDPATSAQDFTEHLVFTTSSFFTNDYAQVQSHVMWRKRPFPEAIGLPTKGSKKFVFASFSNFGKINPNIFDTWANILRRVPQSVLWLLKHPGHEEASENLRAELERFGVDSSRLLFTDFQPWIHHLLTKTNADLILDTTLKNGHTSTADALWAGVPVITLCGKRMSVRIASSIVSSLSSDNPASVSNLTIVRSLREYEDVAVTYANNKYLSAALDARLEKSRLVEDLFNTKTFTKSFEITMRNIYDMHTLYGSRAHLYSGPVCVTEIAKISTLSRTLPSTSRCGKPPSIEIFDMPYDPHTSNFYSDKESSDRNSEINKPFLVANDTHSITQSVEALQLYYVGGKSTYKAWKSIPNLDMFLRENRTKHTGQVVAIYVSAGSWNNIKYDSMDSTLLNVTRIIHQMLRPGGKVFLVLKHASHLHLVESALAHHKFCELEHNKGSKFGLFLEDESYFERMSNSQMHYLSALKCVENGQEEKSIAVQIAGRAELSPS